MNRLVVEGSVPVVFQFHVYKNEMAIGLKRPLSSDMKKKKRNWLRFDLEWQEMYLIDSNSKHWI